MARLDKTILSSLGLVALVAAAVGGYFASKGKEAELPVAVKRVKRVEKPTDAAHRAPAFKKRPPPGTQAALAAESEDYVISDEEIKDLLAMAPTVDEAKASRRPRPSQVSEVSTRGLDALVELESCAPGFELDESGRGARGALGCVRREAGLSTFDGPVGFKIKRDAPPGVPAPSPIYEVGRFENGKRNGVFKTFDVSGNLLSERTYKDDLLSGAVDEFGGEGTHLSRTNYLDGFLHGTAIEFVGEDVRLELWGYGTPLDPKSGARTQPSRELEVAGMKP